MILRFVPDFLKTPETVEAFRWIKFDSAVALELSLSRWEAEETELAWTMTLDTWYMCTLTYKKMEQ